jgi:bacterioferritin-associated ferredoxin
MNSISQKQEPATHYIERLTENTESLNGRTESLPHGEPSKADVNIAYIGMDLDDLCDTCIISYSRTKLAIRLAEMYWDFPHLALVPTDSTSFNFESYRSTAKFNVANIKASQILLATNIFSLSYRGTGLRISTIGISFRALRCLTKCADKKNITIQELISLPAHIDFIEEIAYNFASTISKMVADYVNLTSNTLNLKPHKRFFQALRQLNGHRYDREKQTPVIPSRILHARYHHYNDITLDFIKHGDVIEALSAKLAEDPLYGRDSSKISRYETEIGHQQALEKKRPNFARAISDHNLNDFCKKYNIRHPGNLARHLALAQHCAKCLVHIYTLVRDHEAKLLEDDCVQQAEGWNSKGLYLMGISTKLTGTAKDTAWIANVLITEPIKSLQIIKSIIAPYVPEGTPGSDCLLLTPSFLPFCKTDPGDTLIIKDFMRYEKYLPRIFIEENDILQLEAIDPLADWHSDPKYKVGKPWKIASHQFRRTMAVFGAQSQVLDIPELKRLLTHLTESMSVYYQRGCSAGGYNMKLKSPELANDFKNAMNDAQWISYLNEVLYSTEKLHGGHGKRVTPRSKADDPNRIIYRQTAEETMQKAKKGLISYQRTPLGGCASSKPCNERAHGNFANCFGCASSVLKASNVKSVIEHAQIDLMDLDPKSFEYRMEQRNIHDYEVILSHLN